MSINATQNMCWQSQEFENVTRKSKQEILFEEMLLFSIGIIVPTVWKKRE
jgi:hypothetical protein